MINKEVLVSIVTPVYNQAGTLRETIESVLGQTYPNIEYIIVNDGSTDDTEAVIKEYESVLKVIRQENQGQAAALNTGWCNAKGRYLAYLSADDILYSNCIDELVKSIDDKYVVYYPDFDLIDAHSKIIRTIESPEYSQHALLGDLVCQPGLAALFCADAYRKAGGWDSKYRFIPDYEFWARMSCQGPFQRVKKVLGGFRVHENSGSVKSVSEVHSDEIICFVASFDGFGSSEDRNKAKFQAYLMSARSHFQSKRFKIGVKRFYLAFKENPSRSIEWANVKFVLNGALRRAFYRAVLTFSRRK